MYLGEMQKKNYSPAYRNTNEMLRQRHGAWPLSHIDYTRITQITNSGSYNS